MAISGEIFFEDKAVKKLTKPKPIAAKIASKTPFSNFLNGFFSGYALEDISINPIKIIVTIINWNALSTSLKKIKPRMIVNGNSNSRIVSTTASLPLLRASKFAIAVKKVRIPKQRASMQNQDVKSVLNHSTQKESTLHYRQYR